MSRFTLIARKPPVVAPPPPAPEHPDRREALAWMTAGVSLAMASCGKPPEAIVPQVDALAEPGAGEVERYATALPLGGYARGAIVTTREGRPTKVEGDPRHPFSLGATDVFAEAEVLSLYDPSRLHGVEGPSGPVDWSAFASAWSAEFERLKARAGAGFTLVTPRITSPTELRLIAELQLALPRMTWRRFEAINDDHADAGAQLAFGRRVDARVDIASLSTLLCLDADPLGPGPQSLAMARAYSLARSAHKGAGMLRLYAAEPGWSLTGMNADHRLASAPGEVGELALAVANGLGAGLRPSVLSPDARRFVDVALADLRERNGAVFVGRSQPEAIHAMAHWINARLKAPVSLIQRVDPHPASHGASCRDLLNDLEANRVDTLVTLGGDPAGDAGGPRIDLAFHKARLHLCAADRPSATSAMATWRLGLTHPLESWGDLRAPDGSASLVQPMIRPLRDGRSAAQILALLLMRPAPDARALVTETWATSGGEPETRFRQALSDGVIAPPAATGDPPQPPPPQAPPPAFVAHTMLLTLAPDPTLYDGRFRENAWLQECPKPLSHETWGASLAVAPEDARRLHLKTGDHLRFAELDAPVPIRITPGQAVGVISGYLGGAGRGAGVIGRGAGVDLAAIRPSLGDWIVPLRTIAAAPGQAAPPAFSRTARLEGDERRLSPIVAAAALQALKPVDLTPPKPLSLHGEAAPYSPSWAMVIDAAACIGCNACVVACQAENNVPVVGPAEVAQGRDMHWLRIDAYDLGGDADPRIAFQPVPCMQCEHAPCEPVCPVEASVHDHEGLNDQVYNRCIGTRFCQANCPYKVRRFNFHGYSHEQAYENLGDASFDGQKNPDVTVRARGVMEKCTYCVQRISQARRGAEKEGRDIREGEVVTACQSACPTRAIHFGDLAEHTSDVSSLRREPRHYALLAELGTRPRTTYLARIRNPSPRLEPTLAAASISS